MKVLKKFFQRLLRKKLFHTKKGSSKAWTNSRLDKPNDNGVDFQVGPPPKISTLDDLFQLIEASEVCDLHDYSYGRMLGFATDGLSEKNRPSGLFLVNLVTSILKPSFSKEKTKRTIEINIGELVTVSGTPIIFDEEYRSLIAQYREIATNPTLRFRFNLVMFDQDILQDRVPAVQNLYQYSIEAARHLFRYAGYSSQIVGIRTLEVAAFLASKYPRIIESLDDILCSVRYVLHQDNSGVSIKSELASLLSHFLKHPKWKQDVKNDDTTIGAVIANLRYEWVIAALNNDVWRLEGLRDHLREVFIAIERKDQAEDVWERTKDLLQGYAEGTPGMISDGVIERLLNDGKSRLTTSERKELIKLKRESVQKIVDSIKPKYGYDSSPYAAQEFLNLVLQESGIENRLQKLFQFNYIPSDTEINQILSEQAGEFPLLSLLGVKKVVGDRDDGGTSSDPQFKKKETRLQYASFFMAEVCYPVFQELTKIPDKIEEFARQSYGWDESYKEQFNRHIRRFSEDPMQSLMYGISYLEGFLRRSLDNAGVSVDKEKNSGEVIHGSMYEALLAELRHFGFDDKEIEVFRLFLIEGTAGWNIRNHAYHGIAGDSAFTMEKAAAILFIHLKIAITFREVDENNLV